MLLDTHVLLWLMKGDERMGPLTREALLGGEVVASAASLWECAIKVRAGKLQLDDDFLDRVERAGVALADVSPALTWSTRSVAGVAHRDPFDRLLVAQAGMMGVPLVTADRALLDSSPTLEGRRIRLLDARA